MAVPPKLRKLRRAVSFLKRKGLLPASVDARSVLPWTKYRGRFLSTIVDRYDDVISKKVTPVRVPHAELVRLRKSGYETSKGFVLVPHTATQRVYVTPTGHVATRNTVGMERVQIPIPFHKLEQYLRDIAKDHKRINRMKARNEWFGFRIFGGSTNLYSNIQQAIAAISGYRSIVHAAGLSRKKQLEVYMNLELVRIKDTNKWSFPAERRHERSKESSRLSAKRYRAKMRKAPLSKRIDFLEQQAQRQRDRRARLVKDKKAYKTYLKDARKRSQKNRDKKKPKGKK